MIATIIFGYATVLLACLLMIQASKFTNLQFDGESTEGMQRTFFIILALTLIMATATAVTLLT